MMHDEEILKPKTYKRKDRKPPVMADKNEISALNRLAVESLRHSTAKYEDSPQGLEIFRKRVLEYFDYIDETNADCEDGKPLLFADIESLCCFCGISRNTLIKYGYRENEWGEFVARLKDVIVSSKKTLALKNKLSAVMTMFDLTNNSGYLNSSEFHLSTGQPTDEEKIVSALPDIYSNFDGMLEDKTVASLPMIDGEDEV